MANEIEIAYCFSSKTNTLVLSNILLKEPVEGDCPVEKRKNDQGLHFFFTDTLNVKLKKNGVNTVLYKGRPIFQAKYGIIRDSEKYCKGKMKR